MHRVYNSAFMHMLRDEDNAGYRRVLKETLEFDPEILKRYVNFMNNPDEKSAVEQFGKGDKYIGVATLLATLPGLPMFGHGQFEGFAEKYGMEFRRATMDEQPDPWLIERHEREIVPLLHRRGDFAEARDFLLYDFGGDGGGVDEHVFAYSNGSGPSRSLIVYHNRYAETAGWIRDSVGFAVKAPDGSKRGGAADAGRRPGAGRGAGRRAVAGAARAALGPRVPALRGGDPRARPARGAPGLRDARVLGAARAVGHGRRVGAPGGAAGRPWRALARGRAARAPAGPRTRRAAPRRWRSRPTSPSSGSSAPWPRPPGPPATGRRSRMPCWRW